MTHRAQPNGREIQLLAAIAHEAISYVRKLRKLAGIDITNIRDR
jgi:hypothetical protein